MELLTLTGLILHAKCNDKCDVYVDGLLTASTSDRRQIRSSTIPRASRQITVAAENTAGRGEYAQILINVSNGFTSSDKWVCLNGSSSEWTSTDYNDSNWPPAIRQKKNSGATITPSEPFEGASPIWFKLRPNELGWGTCRGKLGRLGLFNFVNISLVLNG